MGNLKNKMQKSSHTVNVVVMYLILFVITIESNTLSLDLNKKRTNPIISNFLQEKNSPLSISFSINNSKNTNAVVSNFTNTDQENTSSKNSDGDSKQIKTKNSKKIIKRNFLEEKTKAEKLRKYKLQRKLQEKFQKKIRQARSQEEG